MELFLKKDQYLTVNFKVNGSVLTRMVMNWLLVFTKMVKKRVNGLLSLIHQVNFKKQFISNF